MSLDPNAIATAYQPNNTGATGWDPIANPVIWDFFLIGSVRSPGICVVHEFKRRHEFDVKKSKGVYGATITFVGRPPAQGIIEVKLWQSQHFADYEQFIPMLKYDPTKTQVTAVDIYYPSLDKIDIRSVVCESIGNITHEGQKLYKADFEFIEYYPPPPASAVSTPTTSTPDTDPNKPGDPPEPVGEKNDRIMKHLTTRAADPNDAGGLSALFDDGEG